MNAFFVASSLWSFKKELKLVMLAFLVVISLPVIAVFILTHTGINVVSDALVGVDSETKNIQILDPTSAKAHIDNIGAFICRPDHATGYPGIISASIIT